MKAISMQKEQCIFCSIISQKIPAPIIAQNDDVFVIKDINPRAPTHYLLITKKHISSLNTLESTDMHLTQSLFSMAQELAQTMPNQSCRLIINNGKTSGQSVFHLHMHFLSGKKMVDF